MKTYFKIIIWPLLLVAFLACGNKGRRDVDETQGKPQRVVIVPSFNADSAYCNIKEQVAFGPRVPNSKAHVACSKYLIGKLSEYGAKVYTQQARLTAYDGTLLNACNIIGTYNPECKRRVLLLAHWDSRPWADADPVEANRSKPILGANDGASGVGVLLEVARQLQQQSPAIGIDILFADAEDWGPRQDENVAHEESAWALGTQYWANNPHVVGYNARFGILLDMVGGENSVFKYEDYSEYYAKDINRKVWKAAHKLGYGKTFRRENGGGVTDDHLFVNRLARIPCIDIIPSDDRYGFYKYWHTTQDDMNGIDRLTLKAVGQTVLEVIYNEQ